uniref:25S rRNA (uridine-N(3))-methyltransferase BMT5-like domain-containing protein n=1 Tax=Setaria italica TaxID=4555 RepID=K4A2R6_SETIT
MAVGVASPAVGHAAGDDAGQATSGVAGDDQPIPAEGVRELELEGKGAEPSEGVPVAIAVEGKVEENVSAAAAEAEDEGGDAGDEEEEGEKLLGCYSSTQSILLVGDGDFSFSLALATAFRSGTNIVTTSLDTYGSSTSIDCFCLLSRRVKLYLYISPAFLAAYSSCPEVLLGKYSEAESNIMKLKSLETTVLHGVDVKIMKFHTDLKNKRFDRIVFNFPHAGFRGREDQVHMINSHKRLLRDFFCSALYLLIPYGEIHVRHKTGGPYDRWDLEQLASDSSLIIFEKEKFQITDYPGYNHKRGDGARCDQPFPLGPSCTFKLQIGDLKRWKKSSGNNATSTSFLGGSNVRPSGKLETDTRLLHLLPPVQARPWLHFTPPANTVRMPIPPQPYIFAQRQQPGPPLSLDGIVRALFHPQPMFSIAGPSLNAWRAPGSISSSMSRIACPNLLAPQEQPWHQRGSIAVQPGGDGCSYFEHQRCLQRDYEVRRKAMMPGAAGLSYSSAFLESVQRQEGPMECGVQRKATMPGAAGLNYSSAFLEQCRRDVQ